MSNKEKLGAKKDEKLHQDENFISKCIHFFNQHYKIIYGVVIGILVIICANIALNKFYLTPRTQDASAKILIPIEYFMRGDSISIQIALEGDDENIGFLSIISDYSFTKSANTAKYFAGLCYLKLNDKEEALSYLMKFKHKDDIFWYASQAIIGDIYDDLGETNKAIKYYKNAVTKATDPYFTPITLFKLGRIYEREEKWKDAVDCYKEIEEKFYQEYMQMGIDKFVENAMLNTTK
jgi:tetratricopeptide (TPR) repeat protein